MSPNTRPCSPPCARKPRSARMRSMRPQRARALAAASGEEFLAQLAAAAGPSLGKPIEVRSVCVQPLSLKVRTARVSGNHVYIGNAAQTLHPVAGQGLNLGLRDAWDLAKILKESQITDLPALLRR